MLSIDYEHLRDIEDDGSFPHDPLGESRVTVDIGFKPPPPPPPPPTSPLTINASNDETFMKVPVATYAKSGKNVTESKSEVNKPK